MYVNTAQLGLYIGLYIDSLLYINNKFTGTGYPAYRLGLIGLLYYHFPQHIMVSTY